MRLNIILIPILLAASPFALAASTPSTPATKAIAATYAEDKKLCAEESDSGARMQCLRDAKAEYTKSMDAAKKEQAAASKPVPKEPACVDCGKVLSVNIVEKKGEGGAIGMIGGGVVGALLGNQIGGGKGKTLATVAGAAGGAYAGKKVEENVNTTNVWSVRVRFDNGQEQSYEFDHEPSLMTGDVVQKSGNSVVRR